MRGGFQVVAMDSVSVKVDIFTTAAGNFMIRALERMKKMRNNAIVGNVGHFDNEIEVDLLENHPGSKAENNLKPLLDKLVIPDNHGVRLLAFGCLVNLGCATGHPSFVRSCSFTSLVLAQRGLAGYARRAQRPGQDTGIPGHPSLSMARR
jgi:adenosylhomocysteinase